MKPKKRLEIPIKGLGIEGFLHHVQGCREKRIVPSIPIALFLEGLTALVRITSKQNVGRCSIDLNLVPAVVASGSIAEMRPYASAACPGKNVRSAPLTLPPPFGSIIGRPSRKRRLPAICSESATLLTRPCNWKKAICPGLKSP